MGHRWNVPRNPAENLSNAPRMISIPQQDDALGDVTKSIERPPELKTPLIHI